MFNDLTIPYDAKMLFNVVKLKPEYSVEDAELAMGEMCNVVKNTYRDDGGFIAGQVFKFSGFVSDEGSLISPENGKRGSLVNELTNEHLVIITYWKSFEQHEASHANKIFKDKFDNLLEMCDETFEVGYQMLWQGEPE